jgi:hypothetical protein
LREVDVDHAIPLATTRERRIICTNTKNPTTPYSFRTC